MGGWIIVPNFLGLRSISVEIDTNLCSLQEEIKHRANVIYELIQENANCIDLTEIEVISSNDFYLSTTRIGRNVGKCVNETHSDQSAIGAGLWV